MAPGANARFFMSTAVVATAPVPPVLLPPVLEPPVVPGPVALEPPPPQATRAARARIMRGERIRRYSGGLGPRASNPRGETTRDTRHMAGEGSCAINDWRVQHLVARGPRIGGRLPPAT